MAGDRSGISRSTSDVARLTFEKVFERQEKNSDKNLEGQKGAARTFLE